jgi:NhaA family Na+:H+ antiporter
MVGPPRDLRAPHAFAVGARAFPGTTHARLFTLSFIAVALGLCRLPLDLAWRHVFGAGLLGGIGFTMSIFITNLAFGGQAQAVVASKMAILVASLTSGVLGYAWLKLGGAPTAADTDPATVDYAGSDAPRD